MNEIILPAQLYDYFILPNEEEYVFKWGEAGNEDCHIWLGATYEDAKGDETAVLFPCVSPRQARDNHVARILYHKANPTLAYRMLEPEFLHHTCGNSMCVNPDHTSFSPPVLEHENVPTGRKRKELDTKTLNLAYTLYTVHGQTLDNILVALNLKISRATLHRRLQERKDTYV